MRLKRVAARGVAWPRLGLLVTAVACTACGARTGLPSISSSEEGGAGGTGGVAGTGGTGGNGGTEPQAQADKIDLLFMIDGSGSMADKQQILGLAIPDLVHRLNSPLCVAPDGTPVAPQPSQPTAACPAGSEREFNPVQDMHIGVISSSLGGHGAPNGCGFAGIADDQAHLLERGAVGQTYQGLGFLAWDPARTKSPPGETDAAKLEDNVRSLVSGVGESGCAVEASLEAWYRFLVDPEPYEGIRLASCAAGSSDQCAVLEGVDQVLLTQRADFLRPDSLVAVIMLTDENDCSIIDGGTAFRVLDSNPMPRATSVCNDDPADPCCRSCAGADLIDSCPSRSSDPECAKGPWPAEQDSFYLRCFQQKRRFGIDALYPVERYIAGLTQPTVPRRDGTLVENPLYATGDPAKPPRDASLVFLAGIVGVPWQDVARDFTNDREVVYKTARELESDGVWDVILGDPERGIPPADPLMIESIEERAGVNPITGDALQPSSTMSPTANPINGHEAVLDYAGVDLQYACVFELPAPRDCSGSAYCDCGSQAFGANKPICQAPDGSYGSTQFRAKAFPALRQLAVLKGIGDNAIVASICARNVTDPSRQDYGYRPALGAILDRLSAGLL
jgi:hypothetical protein